MEKANILIVDDDESFRLLIEAHLKGAGFIPILSSGGADALKILREIPVDLIIADQVMSGMNGMELLARVKAKYSGIPVIMMTAYGSIVKAVEAMRMGAYDYVEKPYNPDDLLAAISRALEFSRLNEKNRMLREHLRGLYSFQDIVTRSPLMVSVLDLSEKASKSPRATVSIYGESGAGKEVLARAIHYAGEGMENRFVIVNCSSAPSAILERELFGDEKGATVREREGNFGLARGGTIFLDEIGGASVGLQAKLLRVLRERVYEKAGSGELLPADFRVIAASRLGFDELVGRGKFREDLLNLLNVFPITVPPLRERKEDIPMLVDYYWSLFRRHQGKPLPGVSRKAMDALMQYSWPGNVRELRNRLERAALTVSDELIRPEHLGLADDMRVLPNRNVELHLSFGGDEFSLDEVVKRVLEEMLMRCRGNKSLAAKRLGVNRKMFGRKGLSYPGDRE